MVFSIQHQEYGFIDQSYQISYSLLSSDGVLHLVQNGRTRWKRERQHVTGHVGEGHAVAVT